MCVRNCVFVCVCVNVCNNIVRQIHSIRTGMNTWLIYQSEITRQLDFSYVIQSDTNLSSWLVYVYESVTHSYIYECVIHSYVATYAANLALLVNFICESVWRIWVRDAFICMSRWLIHIYECVTYWYVANLATLGHFVFELDTSLSSWLNHMSESVTCSYVWVRDLSICHWYVPNLATLKHFICESVDTSVRSWLFHTCVFVTHSDDMHRLHMNLRLIHVYEFVTHSYVWVRDSSICLSLWWVRDVEYKNSYVWMSRYISCHAYVSRICVTHMYNHRSLTHPCVWRDCDVANMSWYWYRPFVEWVTSHIWMSHVMSYIWMSHVTHLNESLHKYEWVTSHMWMSHVIHMNESRHTFEWVIAQIWMSHVTHVNESCHTYEW